MPVPEKRTRFFVKREKTIQAFDEFMQSPGRVWVSDMTADHGLGKTTVLLHLYRSRGKIKHAWLDMKNDKYRLHQLMDEGAPDAARAITAAQEDYRTLLLDVAIDLFGSQSEVYVSFEGEIRTIMPSNFTQTAKFVSQLSRFIKKVSVKPEVSVMGVKLGLGGVELDIPLEKKHNVQALHRMRTQMTSALAKQIVSLGISELILIVMDDLCHFRDTFLEKWILTELVPALDGCKIILSHTDIESPFLSQDAYHLPLEQYSLAETRQYVSKRLGPEALDMGIDANLQAHYDGHPQKIEWAVDSIEMVGLAQAQEQGWMKRRPKTDTGSDIVSLAEAQIGILAQRDPSFAQAIEIACVLAEFDRKLFIQVISDLESEIDILNFGDLQTQFEKLSFIERKGHGTWIVHPQVAKACEKAARQRNANLVERIHQSAAAYYGTLMQKEEEDSDQSIWERLHRYEMGYWQERSHNWLRHLAASPDASLEIATRYFDAYFWWGEYVDFPFCDHLVASLKATSLSERSRKIVNLIDRFHQAFVPMRRREQDCTWATEVLVILSQLRDRAGLHRPAEDDAVRWHLLGLLENYIAEALCAQDWRAPRAEAAYQASTSAFFRAGQIYRTHIAGLGKNVDRKMAKRLCEQADTDDWYGAWMCIWLSGWYARLGRSDEAIETAAYAKKIILRVDPNDIEAIGRIHAYRGDVQFYRHEWTDAFQEYNLYALHSLGFLIDEYGIGGDIYTLEFLREMIELLYKRMEEIETTNPEMLMEWWRGLYTFWQPEGQVLLPQEVTVKFPGRIVDLLQKDHLGRAVAHQLPLPRLPEYQLLDNYGLDLLPEYSKATESAFYHIRERCYQQGILDRTE